MSCLLPMTFNSLWPHSQVAVMITKVANLLLFSDFVLWEKIKEFRSYKNVDG